MKIVSLSIPTPFYVGDVNVYLIREDPLTLIDTGPKTAEAAAALEKKLRGHGVHLKDIRRIVLTHAHEDHCGLTKRIRDTAGNAEIFVHKWETGHLFGRLSQENQKNLMTGAGVPEEVFQEMRATYEKISLLTDSLAETEYTELKDEQELEFAGGTLKVLHTPGHTPGSCSFWRAADRTLICGDCVLKRITPNPIVSPDPQNFEKRFPSLGSYLKSLERIRELAPTMLYSGHGEPIEDFEEIYHRYRKAFEERQKKIISLVSKDGSTAWDIAGQLFPDAVEKGVHRFLAVSETIAHLDFAATEDRIGVELSDGVEIYRK
jgi:glyoxylase-like metal-dependent hydrolase (beta-lactamase superfamily II)